MEDMKRKRKTRHRIRKAAFGLLLVLLCIMMGTGIFYAGKGYGLYREAIAAKSLDERIRDIRGVKEYTTCMELPQFYIKAAICTEDHRFKDHCGIDPFAIARAAWTDIKAGAFVEGGSTITQQLVKNLLFTEDKKMERKFAEVFAALEVESKYTKEEIFELYANTVYFGSGYYGIYEASMGYFGKEPSKLTDYESAMLAGVPNAPSLYSPDTDKEAARRRAGQVLDSMVRQRIITKAEAERIRSNGLNRIFSFISAAPTKLRPVHTPSEQTETGESNPAFPRLAAVPRYRRPPDKTVPGRGCRPYLLMHGPRQKRPGSRRLVMPGPVYADFHPAEAWRVFSNTSVRCP